MITDKLYQLAFEYKKTKLWKFLWDTQVFAVKLSDGNIGYISIMGMAGEHCALGLYIGTEGLDSFRTIAKANQFMMTPMEFQESLLQQNCLQCAFEGKDVLSEEEQEETKAFAHAHGIRLAGKNAYPHFEKYQPNCYPWFLQTEQEQEYLCEALEAAIELTRRLEAKYPQELGLVEIGDHTENILMLEQNNGEYFLGRVKLPKPQPVIYPAPKAENDISVARLKKIRKAGVWECEIIICPGPIQNSPEDIPTFPMIFLAVENRTDFILPILPVVNYNENAQKLLDSFIEACLQHKICPAELKVRDERTYAFAEALCGKLGIKISIDENLPVLDGAEYDFMRQFGMTQEEEMEQMLQMLEDISEWDEEALHSIPEEMIAQFGMLAEQGVLPDELEQKLNQVFHFTEKEIATSGKVSAHKGVPAEEKSYVISVSLGTGCYRHIQISESSTLLELHKAILDAFEFDDDHAHAFFMDNKKWSDWDCYFVEGIENDYRTTNRYRLRQVGLHKGMQFKYVFDFGDEWTFQCKVLRVVDETTEEPVVIRRKGEAPEQYGFCEEEWDDDF